MKRLAWQSHDTALCQANLSFHFNMLDTITKRDVLQLSSKLCANTVRYVECAMLPREQLSRRAPVMRMPTTDGLARLKWHMDSALKSSQWGPHNGKSMEASSTDLCASRE